MSKTLSQLGGLDRVVADLFNEFMTKIDDAYLDALEDLLPVDWLDRDPDDDDYEEEMSILQNKVALRLSQVLSNWVNHTSDDIVFAVLNSPRVP